MVWNGCTGSLELVTPRCRPEASCSLRLLVLIALAEQDWSEEVGVPARVRCQDFLGRNLKTNFLKETSQLMSIVLLFFPS